MTQKEHKKGPVPVDIKRFDIHVPLFFTELAQGDNEVIWLLEFDAFFCYS